MPIRIKTDLEFGSIWYLKNDREQIPRLLVGVVVIPGNQFLFKLSNLGEVDEVYDFECSQEINPLFNQFDE